MQDDVTGAGKLPDAAWRRTFRRKLRAWYRLHARHLPWRGTRDPYRVWVSEIMLQQTQVATVVAYFPRFLQAFPTVTRLAAAEEPQVLRLWEGLGYYRRARQLHQAAKIVVQEHGGQFPQDVDDACALPGIGRYTAGAILSISRDARLPILEANTIRLLSRLLALRDDPQRAASQRVLWQAAEALLPRVQVGAFNQALMELGSEICSPRNPSCEACPVASLCLARRHDLQHQIPPPKRPTAYQQVREAAVVVESRQRVLLRQCGAGERWAGLWDFPRFPVQARSPAALRREMDAKVAQLTGVTVQTGRRLATIKHSVTRYRITLLCHQAACLDDQHTGSDTLRWVRPRQLEQLPLSVTGRKICRFVCC